MSSDPPARVFLSLGSNLGDRERYLLEAVENLRRIAAENSLRVSSIYETEPWGVENQPLYLNAVVELEYTGTPEELLDATQALERAAGRVRGVERWAARTLDIDILLFGDLILNTERLTIPHPRMLERFFVLKPLSDLAPHLNLPDTGVTVAEALLLLLRTNNS